MNTDDPVGVMQRSVDEQSVGRDEEALPPALESLAAEPAQIEPNRGAGSLFRRLLTPSPMMKVSLFFLADDAAEVVSAVARQGVCQVERLPKEVEDFFTPYFPEAFRESFYRLRQRYETLIPRWGRTANIGLGSDRPQVPSVGEMDRVAVVLAELSDQLDELDHRRKQIERHQSELDYLSEYLRVLSELDLGLHQLPEMRFLHVRVGTVPLENFGRLQESAELSDDLVFYLGESRDRAHVMVVGAGPFTAAMEGLLAKAHFESSDPSASLLASGGEDPDASLQQQAAAADEQLRALEHEQARLQLAGQPVVTRAARVLAQAAVFAQCDGALGGRLPVAFLSGWVARRNLPALEQTLQREVAHPVVVVAEPASSSGSDAQPPSEMDLPALFRSGGEFVSLYGAPGYNELNPALVLVATTPLMFGMMFGDVGHGLLLALAAVACRRWLKQWWSLVFACSIGAVVFGFLYGSVFGIEHWLPSFWLRPMEEPMRLIAMALWAGVGFMLLTFVLKALSLSVQGRLYEAVFAFEGMAGAALYLGVVFVLRAVHLDQTVSAFAWALAVAGLVLIGIHAGGKVRLDGRPALVELASDYFHGILTLMTNTLSFLRLAAFALAHGALSVALYLIIEMIPPTAFGWVCRILVLLVGSAAILAIDLLAVGVQTVRLQFYEGLARYYRGDGRSYRALRFPRTLAT